MPATYEPIATQTLGSSASSITFSSIPSTYTDFRVVYSYIAAAGQGGNATLLRVNSDTGSNYSFTNLTSTGGTPNTSSVTSNSSIPIEGSSPGTYSNIPTFVAVNIFAYASASVRKTFLIEMNHDVGADGGIVRKICGMWNSTSAINSITLSTSSQNFGAGTTATIYGIKAA